MKLGSASPAIIGAAVIGLCVTASPPLAAATTLYWTETTGWPEYQWEIRRRNLASSEVELVLGNLGPLNSYWAPIEIDAAASKMYWGGPSPAGAPRGIHRANLDGSSVQTIVTLGAFESALDLALDPAAGKIYWTEDPSKRVRRANLDGSGIEDLLTLEFPTGIAVAPASGKLYITEFDGKVHRTDLDGSNDEVLQVEWDGPAGATIRESTNTLCFGHGEYEKLWVVDTEFFHVAGYAGCGVHYLDVAIDPEAPYAYATGVYFLGLYKVPLALGCSGSEQIYSGIARGVALHFVDDCGNGTVDFGEECDDGNETPADGCEPDCTETLAVPAASLGSMTVMLALLAAAAGLVASRRRTAQQPR